MTLRHNQLNFNVTHVHVALWAHPAGFHGRPVFPNWSSAPPPATTLCLFLHLDSRSWLCKRWFWVKHFFMTSTRMKYVCKTLFFLWSWPDDEQCRYMCQSDGENFIVSRGSQFVDGTRCESDSLPPFGTTVACLQGRCQVIKWPRRIFISVFLSFLHSSFVSAQLFGCNGALQSGKVWDVCGVCGGDGSTCSLTSDSYSGGKARGNKPIDN